MILAMKNKLLKLNKIYKRFYKEMWNENEKEFKNICVNTNI